MGHARLAGLPDAVTDKSVGLKENLLKPRTYLGFAVAAVVIYIFLRNFRFSDAVAVIAEANWLYLLAAAAAFYLSLPVRGRRWGVLLRPTETVIPTQVLTHYYFLAWFVNAILPARIGDIYRAYLLRKNKNVPVPLSLGVLFSERIFDLAVAAALVVLSGTYFWAVLKGSDESRYLAWGVAGTAAMVGFFVIILLLLPRVSRITPKSWHDSLDSFQEGLFKWPSLLPTAILMTLVIWLSEALRLYLVFMAFGVKAGFLAAVFISQAALILMSIPLSPAGLGLVELMMLRLLASADVTLAVAGAVTLTDRLISYWSLVISGAIAYILSPRQR
jgi:uncharacterized membrane protein YbhN (UPF0104 family)